VRELTKAAGRFTWSLSLFGARQLANLFATTPDERSAGAATEGFESVSRAAAERLGPFLSSSYRAGAQLQDELVDLAFDMWSPRAFDPRWWSSRTAQLARSSMESMSQVASGGAGGAGGPGESGWGPMPPWSDGEDRD
jgi:hypothetical protein